MGTAILSVVLYHGGIVHLTTRADTANDLVVNVFAITGYISAAVGSARGIKMDVVIAIVLAIEIVFIFVSSILVIIRNLEWFKRKMADAQLLLFDIILSLIMLSAMVAIIVAVIHMHIPLFETDVWPVWTAIIVLPLIIIRLVYDYRKENKKEGANNELRIR